MKTIFLSVLAVILISASLYANVTVSFPFQDVTVRNSNGIAQFSGSGLSGEPGSPALPVYTRNILLPPDADLSTVSISIENYREELLQGNYTVMPAPPKQMDNKLLWLNPDRIVDGKDISIYNKNTLYPREPLRIIDLGMLHVYKIITITFYPVRYNPVTKELFKIGSGTCVLNFKRESAYASPKNRGILVPENIPKRVAKLVENYNEFAAQYASDFNFIPANKMVIITTSAIKTGSKKFEAFLESKKARKLDVQVVLESEWGGSNTALRKWLQDNYQKLGIHHVLLIGNPSGDVPMTKFPDYNPYMPNDVPPSEFPYAQLSGEKFTTDAKCEVSVGRIPVYNNDLNTLDGILEKTIAYENTDKNSVAWRFNALMGAAGFDAKSLGDIPYNMAHEDFILKMPWWKDYRIYGTKYGQPQGTPDKKGISEAVFTDQWAKNPYGIVTWLTHGSSTGASYIFSSGSAKKIGNKNPSFVICGSCTNASISAGSGSLCFSVLRDCGVGVMGGTSYTDYEPKTLDHIPTAGSNEGFAYNFVRCMAKDSMEAGDCITYLRDLDPDYPTGKWLNRAPYVLYGDPSIGIYTWKKDMTDIAVSPEQRFALRNPLSYTQGNKGSVLFRFNTVRSGTSAQLRICAVTGAEIYSATLGEGTNTLVWDLSEKQVGMGMYIATVSTVDAQGRAATTNTVCIVKR